jgi:hypothetical protein
MRARFRRANKLLLQGRTLTLGFCYLHSYKIKFLALQADYRQPFIFYPALKVEKFNLINEVWRLGVNSKIAMKLECLQTLQTRIVLSQAALQKTFTGEMHARNQVCILFYCVLCIDSRGPHSFIFQCL